MRTRRTRLRPKETMLRGKAARDATDKRAKAGVDGDNKKTLRGRVRGTSFKRISPVPKEHDEQVAFVKWFRLAHPGVLIFAIPNGGARHPAVASKLKAEGVVAGVADLYVPKWRLWVEMKRTKGGTWTDEQRRFCDYVAEVCGDTYLMARGADDGSKAVRIYLSSKK